MPHRSHHGFTLMEVMVTFTILGFILLMIFGTFRLGLSAWDRGEAIKEEYQKVRAVSQLISRQMKSMVPYKVKTSKADGDYLAFEGKPHSLKFVSALPLRARQAEGLVFSAYEFKEGGKEEGQLILYEQRVLNKDFMEEPPKEEFGASILEGITNVDFEYYRGEDPEKIREPGWVEEWNAKDEKELPRAVRMTLYQKEGQGEKSKPLVVVVASIPSYRYEEVRAGAARRTIPQRPSGP
jgi:prepilin-type N-terminal cleavage/methylation domain-containing protein